VPSVLDGIALGQALDDAGLKRLHMKTVWHEVIQRGRGVAEIAADSRVNMPQKLRKLLVDYFCDGNTEVTEWLPNSAAGTGGKLEVRLHDGLRVETVIIEHQDDRAAGARGRARRRSTVCVSSQVGCKMGCTFCSTGTMGLLAHLTAGEIAEQVAHAKRYCSADAPLRNVVFMGMGEPLDNYDNVLAALRTMNDQAAFRLAYKNITMSTVGVVGRIDQLAEDCPDVNLALSLHAPTQELRLKIVPSGGAFPIDDIVGAIDRYAAKTGRKVMLEYILIDGVNASQGVAHELGRLCEGRRVTVNIIPYNPTDIGEEHGFRTPSDETAVAFQHTVIQYLDADGKKIYVTLRRSSANGRSVEGACGQLVLKELQRRRNKPKANGDCAKEALPDIEDLGAGGNDANGGAAVKRKRRRRRPSPNPNPHPNPKPDPKSNPNPDPNPIAWAVALGFAALLAKAAHELATAKA